MYTSNHDPSSDTQPPFEVTRCDADVTDAPSRTTYTASKRCLSASKPSESNCVTGTPGNCVAGPSSIESVELVELVSRVIARSLFQPKTGGFEMSDICRGMHQTEVRGQPRILPPSISGDSTSRVTVLRSAEREGARLRARTTAMVAATMLSTTARGRGVAWRHSKWRASARLRLRAFCA